MIMKLQMVLALQFYNQFDKKDATITIKSGGKLYGNKATNGYGGGIYSQNTTITIGENTTNSDSNEEEPITNNNGASICNNQASVGGGGIYGFNSNIILAEDNALYNNAAQKAGDDLFTFGTNSMISLADATKMSGDRKLASDGEKITGWFYDGYKDGWCSRWGAETENGQKYFDAYVTDETAPVQFGLKAAYKPAPPSGGGGGGGGGGSSSPSKSTSPADVKTDTGTVAIPPQIRMKLKRQKTSWTHIFFVLKI